MYVCFEGIDGVGKTTQAKLLFEYVKAKYGETKVLSTSEPGNMNNPLTMVLRGCMLDKQYDNYITKAGRELISQAARALNLELTVEPALQQKKVVIQDRGMLSGFAYAIELGNNEEDIRLLSQFTSRHSSEDPFFQGCHLYDLLFVLVTADVQKCLERAKGAKQEFKKGDAIEEKGINFMEHVQSSMMNRKHMKEQDRIIIQVDGKTIFEIHQEIVNIFEQFYATKQKITYL